MLTKEKLESVLDYDAETGIFRWKKTKTNRVSVGQIAGGLHADSYWVIRIEGKSYRAHRLAWLFMTGKFPTIFIDHINGFRTDNRFVNLRECTVSENARNAGKHKDNKAGFVGVHWETSCDRWRARICVDGKKISLGVFTSATDAAKAYDLAAIKYHGEFAKTNFREV